jgi:hypothetical protein
MDGVPFWETTHLELRDVFEIPPYADCVKKLNML